MTSAGRSVRALWCRRPIDLRTVSLAQVQPIEFLHLFCLLTPLCPNMLLLPRINAQP